MHGFDKPVHCPRRTPSLLCVVAALALVSCAKKTPSNPPVTEPALKGLSLGMARKAVETKLRAAGLQVTCDAARNVTYASGKALYTRWVKKAAAQRFLRCSTKRDKGVKPGPDGLAELRTYFFDDRLVRMHARFHKNDHDFSGFLQTRFGTLRQQPISRYAYASKEPSEIRAWSLRRGKTKILWLRSAYRQQLVLLTLDPPLVKSMQAHSTVRKDD